MSAGELVMDETPDQGRELRTALVLDEVADERHVQHAKWGEQDHPDGTGPTIPTLNRVEQAKASCDAAARLGELTWRHVLTEEYREAMAENDPTKLRAELLQVAAVAVAWVEALDRREGKA